MLLRRLAQELDSLVHVSRRVEKDHLVEVVEWNHLAKIAGKNHLAKIVECS